MGVRCNGLIIHKRLLSKNVVYSESIINRVFKDDERDSHKIADLMRVGMFPKAYVYPKAMRGTRDLLRRRQRYTLIRGEGYRLRAPPYSTIIRSGMSDRSDGGPPMKKAVRRGGHPIKPIAINYPDNSTGKMSRFRLNATWIILRPSTRLSSNWKRKLSNKPDIMMPKHLLCFKRFPGSVKSSRSRFCMRLTH